MHQYPEIKALLQKITKNFKEEITHYRYIKPKLAEYSEPENPIKENLRNVLEKKGINNLIIFLFIRQRELIL